MVSQHIRPPQTRSQLSFSSPNSQLPESSRDSTTPLPPAPPPRVSAPWSGTMFPHGGVHGLCGFEFWFWGALKQRKWALWAQFPHSARWGIAGCQAWALSTEQASVGTAGHRGDGRAHSRARVGPGQGEDSARGCSGRPRVRLMELCLAGPGHWASLAMPRVTRLFLEPREESVEGSGLDIQGSRSERGAHAGPWVSPPSPTQGHRLCLYPQPPKRRA